MTPRGASLLIAVSLMIHGASVPAQAQQQSTGDIRDLKLGDWEPRSMMVTKVTEVDKPKFPAIDVHNHLGGGRQTLTAERVAGYLEEMNAAGVETVVNLDGGWGPRLQETLAALDQRHPGRFLTFALLNFDGIDDDGWSQREAERLEESFRAGAKGLKLHKSLGLTIRYRDGRLMPVDDPKLDPIWEMCAKHDRPVMIHTSDPAAFFTPLDRYNERWHELNEHPNWLFYGDRFPERDELLAARNRTIAKHPDTSFICAHFGNNPEDLATVGRWLDAHPNMIVDLDARISELGRQPYTARRFFLKYQDRIMFGTDTTPRREAFRIYYRFLETDDEYFDPVASHHRQGFWMIYGLFLPDDVLEKIYRTNALRVLLHQEDAGDMAAAGQASDSSAAAAPQQEQTAELAQPVLNVLPCEDFEVTGDGSAEAWSKVDWTPLSKRTDDGHPYEARVKMLYSETGLYVLMDATDRRVTATMEEDFADLWHEDVFEFFLWPDARHPVYFEYEISPLGYELPILIPNFDGEFLGWRPWHYENERKTRKGTSVRGGEKRSGARIEGWAAEVFVPYVLLQPLQNVPPKPGTQWRANFYRVDYDGAQQTGWDWARVGSSFHEYKKFGTLRFQ
ncbi:MAG: amidohydrolase family protein [Pirellulales bacterium]